MNENRYVFSGNRDYTDFIFESKGPKGCIKKIVRYTPYDYGKYTYYNLGFGDLNEITGDIDDLAVSDNKDREKILATVAATVLEFVSHFPNAVITAKGSTAARTRLYQIAIMVNMHDISNYLEVWGFKDGEWHHFRSHVNYDGFLVMKKNDYICITS